MAKMYLGEDEHNKIIHTINWGLICLPKKGGDLGLRRSEQMNKALLVKLGWRLLTEKEKLWSRVIRSKYKIQHLLHDNSQLNGADSHTWKAILWSKDLL